MPLTTFQPPPARERTMDMPEDVMLDPALIQAALEELGLTARPQPTLIWARNDANGWRVPPFISEWDRGVATCLMVLSYRWTWLEPDTIAAGVWLPDYHTVMVVDATMSCHVIPLGASAVQIPERERASVATELRGLIGTALGRPGRGSLADSVLITADPAGVLETLGELPGATALRVMTPSQATGVWASAAHVFIHHDALAEVVAAQLHPRADVTILAPRLTEDVRFAAAALCTDLVLVWPDASSTLVQTVRCHRKMQRLARRLA
ncbi:hypothetical protein HDA40_002151 [Hamadaea flava]|uniref:Uncharacterized protein n=1 Tax=Hamadaea flava TaxID=1742688 RepID=A0ABV8LJQ4_9ACTN|nr:hypothetical protein [Hamadaea flava]MCP2323644.1 hypothetical protein [Hamadaea flava]